MVDYIWNRRFFEGAARKALFLTLRRLGRTAAVPRPFTHSGFFSLLRSQEAIDHVHSSILKWIAWNSVSKIFQREENIFFVGWSLFLYIFGLPKWVVVLVTSTVSEMLRNLTSLNTWLEGDGYARVSVTLWDSGRVEKGKDTVEDE